MGNKSHPLQLDSNNDRKQPEQMKVHQLARGIWDLHEPATILARGCKRLRPPAPRVMCNNDANISALDLKSFIKPDPGARRIEDGRDSNPHHVHSPQVETHLGGTRWNPTQEQIGILEMLYRGGVRTPSAQQIEQITAQLGNYGKIEGKNVFYWFQNHKARERQKQKRGSLAYIHFPRTSSISAVSCGGGEEHISGGDDAPCKRKCRSWGDERKSSNSSCGGEDGSSVVLKTLELFPLRPEGRRCSMS